MGWKSRCAVCPQGKQSVYWREGQRRSGDPFVVARFDSADCNTCDTRALCTRSVKHPRQLFLKPRAQYEALQAMRERITSEEGRELYKVRAGVEGTISQSPDERTAASPLPRSEEDAPAAYGHCRSGQCRSPQRMVGRAAARANAHLTLRSPRRVNDQQYPERLRNVRRNHDGIGGDQRDHPQSVDVRLLVVDLPVSSLRVVV